MLNAVNVIGLEAVYAVEKNKNPEFSSTPLTQNVLRLGEEQFYTNFDFGALAACLLAFFLSL